MVPGNVELDLSRAGLLPDDLYHGENILAVRDWEDAEWWYSTVFTLDAADLDGDVELEFHGVDGDAEYVLNGQTIGVSANSLVGHVVRPGTAARAGENRLTVHLRPPRPPADARRLVPLLTLGDPLRQDGIWVRKPAHAYGWDIMPRALSAGIWRPVELAVHAGLEISALYPAVVTASEDGADVRFYYELRGDPAPGPGCHVVVEGRCGASSFHVEGGVGGPTGVVAGVVASPRRWWPRGYGDPDVYDVTASVVRDGAVLATRHGRVGVRMVELVRDAGDFRFVVNGVPIYCRGTNWVPLDAFHSRDAGLLASRLDLLWRSNSNMVRCWGGNVYENDAFFEWCDEHGVLVWQDLSFANAVYPQTDAFAATVRHEVASVVRRLRHHPSLVLWCGDNEVDQMTVKRGIDPRGNALSRRVIPEVVRAEDPHRPYLPSSPYIADGEAAEALRRPDLRWLPEAHLWGTRDYYKSEFYRGATAAFVSEIGFMGLPRVESMRRFLDEDALWPHENRQWLVHGTDPTVDFGSRFWWRTAMTLECVRIFFGAVPERLADAVVASQLVQAEGFKYAIESGRQAKWRRTGVLWWNLVDGWPQISDAVVDWYLAEKLAFDVIASSQRPLLLMVGEPREGRCPLLACNDTRWDTEGTFRVSAPGRDAPLLEGRYRSPANETARIGELELPAGRSMARVDWEDADGVASNHYLAGSPPFDLERVRGWYDALRAAARW